MKPMPMLATGLKVTSWVSAAAIIISPDAEHLAIWAVFATSLAGVLTNWINRRSDFKMREQQHLWDREERELKAAEIKAELLKAQGNVLSRVDEVGRRADAAYDAANHTNEKLIALAQRPIVVSPDQTQ